MSNRNGRTTTAITGTDANGVERTIAKGQAVTVTEAGRDEFGELILAIEATTVLGVTVTAISNDEDIDWNRA